MHSLKFKRDQRLGYLTANLPTWVTATFAVMTAMCLLLDAGSVYGQVNKPRGTTKPPTEPTSQLVIPPGKVGASGYSPSLAYQLNQPPYMIIY